MLFSLTESDYNYCVKVRIYGREVSLEIEDHRLEILNTPSV